MGILFFKPKGSILLDFNGSLDLIEENFHPHILEETPSRAKI